MNKKDIKSYTFDELKKEIENIDIEIVDKRKYGRATIIFLSLKEEDA